MLRGIIWVGGGVWHMICYPTMPINLWKGAEYTHPDSSEWLHRSHMTQYTWGYFEGTLQLLWQEYHAWSSCNVSSTVLPTCSSLSGTVSYEAYVASQEESGCVWRGCQCGVKSTYKMVAECIVTIKITALKQNGRFAGYVHHNLHVIRYIMSDPCACLRIVPTRWRW